MKDEYRRYIQEIVKNGGSCTGVPCCFCPFNGEDVCIIDYENVSNNIIAKSLKKLLDRN